MAELTNELVAWLLAPAHYPEPTTCVEHIETHISHVFLTDQFAYKLPKPVKFDFLDFSTGEQREATCRNELRLNRRLAADTYIDVVPIRRDAAGEWHWGATSDTTEWLVKMRRLPADRMLDRLIAEGRVTDNDIDRLAAKLLGFYRAAPSLALDPHEYRQHVERHVHANYAELFKAEYGLSPELVKAVHGPQLQLLALKPELLENRAGKGQVVDGHGDLRPDHICLTEEPVIFDCVEFSAELRQIDVLDELAFLAMECDRLGGAWIGQRIVVAYEAQAHDQPASELLPFYKAYRACVRAKVAAFRSRQGDESQKVAAIAEANQYLNLARNYVRSILPPLLLLVRGVSGSGKSTLARALAERLGCELLQTDVVRHELFGRPEVRSEETQRIVYSPDQRRQVYEAMFAHGEQLLRSGVSVVLDGTFLSADLVADAMRFAPAASQLVIDCHCPAEIAKRRIAQRLSAGIDPSEAGPELHDRQLREREEVPFGMPHVIIDSSGEIEPQVLQCIAALRQQIG
jgi:aminoglycoside phosphotransferase family enzyme/predicted kinase